MMVTGDLRTDVGRRHREARALADAPRDARIALRERLDHLKQGRGLDLLAVIGARDQQTEQPRVMQRIEHVIRQATLALDAVAGALDQGGELACPPDQFGRPPLAFRGIRLFGKAI